MSKAVVIVALGALSCGPKPASTVAPAPKGSAEMRWDPCCASRAPSRFERRLTECAKLRSATPTERKRWDCDTLAQDFVRLQDFYRPP